MLTKTFLKEYISLESLNDFLFLQVALCEFVAKIDYITIFYLLNNDNFQRKVLFHVVFELLDDSDKRVRNSAAVAIKE